MNPIQRLKKTVSLTPLSRDFVMVWYDKVKELLRKEVW